MLALVVIPKHHCNNQEEVSASPTELCCCQLFWRALHACMCLKHRPNKLTHQYLSISGCFPAAPKYAVTLTHHDSAWSSTAGQICLLCPCLGCPAFMKLRTTCWAGESRGPLQQLGTAPSCLQRVASLSWTGTYLYADPKLWCVYWP